MNLDNTKVVTYIVQSLKNGEYIPVTSRESVTEPFEIGEVVKYIQIIEGKLTEYTIEITHTSSIGGFHGVDGKANKRVSGRMTNVYPLMEKCKYNKYGLTSFATFCKEDQYTRVLKDLKLIYNIELGNTIGSLVDVIKEFEDFKINS